MPIKLKVLTLVRCPFLLIFVPMPIKGNVLKSTGKWYTVELEDGSIVNCRIRGKIRLEGLLTTNPIAVGDVVIIDDVIDEEGKRTISDFEERKKLHCQKINKPQ